VIESEKRSTDIKGAQRCVPGMLEVVVGRFVTRMGRRKSSKRGGIWVPEDRVIAQGWSWKVVTGRESR